MTQKEKYLITTDAWFYAPNGILYRAVWGEVEIVDDHSVLGIKTNNKSSNWYVKIGSEDNHVIIAGCQIHYACRCENIPNIKAADDYATEGGNVTTYQRPTGIYIAQ